VIADTGGTEQCLSFLVRHAWLSMRTAVAGALAEHGLSVAQYASLMILDEEPGITVADVARKVSSARQSANEMLAGLERSGLIERRPHPRDRRAQQIFLTEPGRERLRAANPTVRAAEAALEAGFSPSERAVARAWLLRMANSTPMPGAEEIPTD
jgi:DNA-binding MarR family transcriptional regulator